MDTMITEIVILFLLSIAVSLACAKLKLPSTVGFLITGILCGPSLLGIVSDRESIDMVAEFGVALLLFTIGMELSGDALSRLKKPVFLGGTLQIGLTVAAVGVLVWLVHGWALNTGLFMGCLVALSSSAIVLRILQERGATNTPSGRLSLAILVFQDIMVAPMLLAVPLLAGTLELSPLNMLYTVGRMVLILGGVMIFGHFLLPRLMVMVVRTRMPEVLLLTTLGICMGLALLTQWLGLSLSLGAFLAGLLLARSEYSMSVISGVLPYKDVFMSIFFISVGMLLDVNFLMNNLWLVVCSTVMFIVIKALLTMPAVLIQGYPLRTAIITSLSLAQVGEFAFVLAASGLDAKLINAHSYQSFLAMSILTMMLTPLLISIAGPLSGYVQRKLTPHLALRDEEEAPPATSLNNHLIIIGFGVSGQHLARVARESGIDYQILEMNPETVQRYKDVEPISHGDAAQAVVLEHLGVHTAKVLAIVISDPAAVRAITATARSLNPSLCIIARTRFFGEIGPLQQLGANEVVSEEFESSLEVFSHVLNEYLVPRQKIDAFTARIRQEQYKHFCSLAQKEEHLESLVHLMPQVAVQAMLVEEGSPVAGKTLAESALRRTWGLTVIAISRAGETLASPDADVRLLPGDIAYVFADIARLHTAAEPFIAPQKTTV
ncbi:MAG: cation:proton antiporter [Desulfovibrionaceae bacterium]